MNRLDWTHSAAQAIRQHGEVALVTQCSVEGSAPREAGTKMLVGRDTFSGTIGGGNLEHQAISQARRLLEHPDKTHVLQDYPLGPLLRQCCGGHVRLLIERLGTEDLSWLDELAATAPGSQVLETKLDSPDRRKHLIDGEALPASAATGFTGAGGALFEVHRPPREACVSFFERITTPPAPIVLYGAGHVGQAIAHVLSISDHPIRWLDSRSDYVGPCNGLVVQGIDGPDDAVSAAEPGAIHLVLTHDHELDYQLTRAILKRNDFLFCGLIGSKTKRARFLKRLRDDGVSSEAIGRLTCPIGLPEIPGKAPSTIAVAVAAQIAQMTAASHPAQQEELSDASPPPNQLEHMNVRSR